MLTNILTISVLAFGFITDVSADKKVIWWAVMFFIILVRSFDIFLWYRQCEKAPEVDGLAGIWRFSIGCVLTALGWCSYVILFNQQMDVIEFSTTVIIIAAMAGGGSSVLAGGRYLALVYSVILLLPFSIIGVLDDEEYRNLLGFLGLVFCVIMSITGLKTARFTREAIRTKNQNLALRDEVTSKGNQFSNVNTELKQATKQLNEINHNLELEVQKRTEKIFQLSNLDSLTGLKNRKAFTLQLDNLIEKAVASGNPVALLFIDLDGFKKINDTMGHRVGDHTLIEVANRLSAFSDRERTGRWGGDEFLVALPYSDQGTAMSIASAMMTSIAQPIIVSGNELYLTASIGIALAPVHSLSAEDLIQLADLTMCEQKQSGQRKPRVFSTELKGKIEASQLILEGLQHALEKKELYLCYQPIQCAKENTSWSFEALLRWNFNGKFIGPDIFIPLAEKSGLIKEIGAWVLNRACMDAKHWQFNQTAAVSVNVSVIQLMDDGFIRLLDNILRSSGLPPERLHLEITESTFVDNEKKIRTQLEQIQSRNIHVSIDDFGTGYSSLSQLQTLPVNYVKIDKAFVDNIEGKGDAIIRATLFIARELNCLTVAEGVETKEQAIALAAMGVDFLQGYYFAKPMKNEDLIVWQNPISSFLN
ncbi:putative bifunctional diguanylate cyclase/phosphodiesterase [Flavobacterium sp. W21_SRS_FM6]|uniref:putative bifunctional diguanylate cyclase/phosphodiesterase n=1 Tax=Flavobacterium sp. W21_SRS_FM6 TaxID=3240268 RepID=UPI003F901FDE